MPLDIHLDCLLFADDTTIMDSGSNLSRLIDQFKLKLTKFIEWVKYNQLTINWKKTKFMIISEKRFTKEKLDFLLLDGNNVEVVKKFRLLGVTIDNCLTFQDHISTLKQKVNIKLFSIKKLKFLSLSTKIHFFKTFIQPHFDYCSTIFTFFNKKLFCNIVKFYNLCIYRLLNINIFHMSTLEQNEILCKYNIMPLSMRFFLKMNYFCYKIVNKLILKGYHKELIFKESLYFRDREIVALPNIKSTYGRLSFFYFLPKFLNKIIKHSSNLPWKEFKMSTLVNLNCKFKIFLDNFLTFN